jgi:hypothetical protein
MSFIRNMYTTQNIRYLRISEKQVLPLIIYLHQENLTWFNDIILQVLFKRMLLLKMLNRLETTDLF